MQQSEFTQTLSSGLTFLRSYQRDYYERKKQIESLEEKRTHLQPMVEESKRIEEQIKSLQNQNKSDEKFLQSMNDVILRATGQPISSGDLFDGANLNNGVTNAG